MLLRQKLAHARTEHGAAVAAAAIGCRARTLELHFPALPTEDRLEDRDSPPIAIAIAGPKRALLGVFRAIDRQRIAAGPARLAQRCRQRGEVAREHAGKSTRAREAFVKAEFPEQRVAVRHIHRVCDRRRPDRHVMTGADFPGKVIDAVRRRLGIAIERAQQRVVRLRGQIVERFNPRGPCCRCVRCHGASSSAA